MLYKQQIQDWIWVLVMRTIVVLLVILFLSCELGAEDVFDLIIKHETNDYYRGKLQARVADNFKTITIQNKILHLISLTGGTHFGVLYIVSPDAAYRIETGPTLNVLTRDDLLPLGEDEILLISATGGTGLHHVFGTFFKINDKTIQAVSSFPILGRANQRPPHIFDYKIGSAFFTRDSMVMNFEMESEHSGKEHFKVTIDHKRQVQIEASDWIQSNLDYVFNLYQNLNILRY